MDLSISDLSIVMPGNSRSDALQQSIAVAKLADRLGYKRFWVGENHGVTFMAGRAPEVLISAVAANTKTIRVGAGSILLNYSTSFKIAEVFCTLNELYPERIDLGIGRTHLALHTDILQMSMAVDIAKPDFNRQVRELNNWLGASFTLSANSALTPIYTVESRPELYVLGASRQSAALAAELGLSYATAGFINHEESHNIIRSYQEQFIPSYGKVGCHVPKSILAVHAVCADTDSEAARQSAPLVLMYQNIESGKLDFALSSPDESVRILGGLPAITKYARGTFRLPKFLAGNLDSLSEQFYAICADFGVNEIMIQDIFTDHTARLHSYELMASLIDHHQYS